MSKVVKNKSHETVEKNRLLQLMPDDAFSIKIMQARARLLSEVDKDQPSAQASLTSYIKFILGDVETYGIPYQDVLDVKKSVNITKVPMSPQFILGVSYWHGKLIPVVDLAKYFNIHVSDNHDEQKIIAAASHDKFIIGLAFDGVSGVDSYLVESLDQNIAVNQKIKDLYVHGIHGGKTTILNVNNLLIDIAAELMNNKGISHE